MEIVELNREQIVNGSYVYPPGEITIIPTKHFIERLRERHIPLCKLPTRVRVTRDNIYSGKTRDNKTLTSVVIRQDFDERQEIFMCLNPFDGGGKSVWFREKRLWKK